MADHNAPKLRRSGSAARTAAVRVSDGDWAEAKSDVSAGEIASCIERLSNELTQVSRRLGSINECASAPPQRQLESLDRVQLAERVWTAIRARRERSKHFPAELFADPAWDLLLDLFHSELRQSRSSITSLCLASRVPTTTALRWIGALSDRGLVRRRPDPLDGRRTYVELTPTALTALFAYFDAVAS